MSYLCDICCTEIKSMASGLNFRDEDINTSPWFWEESVKDMEKMGGNQNAYGLFLQRRLNDSSGRSIVCQECARMLQKKDSQLKQLGLERLKTSDLTTKDMIAMIAGVVWEQKKGNWPSFLHESYKDILNMVRGKPEEQKEEKFLEQKGENTSSVSKKHWWQFWK